MSNLSATQTVLVGHSPGLHARPCLAIVKTVCRFRSKIQMRSGNQKADASDILQLMSMGVPHGAEVTLHAEGPDADEALDALVELFSCNFGFDD
jgi:phosphocarrier protein HPr